MIIDVVLKDGVTGEVVGKLIANEKQFKTGSRGLYANSKIEIAGKRYQAQVQLVEIGSKAEAEKPAVEEQG